MPIRLLLIDDHPIVLAGLLHLLSTETDFEVLATAHSGEEGLRAIDEHRPDVTVLDIRMRGMGGLAVLRELQRAGSEARVVVLTAVNGDEVVEAIRLGARGVVLKETSDLLARCIRAVHAGGKWLEKSIAMDAVDRLLDRDEEMRILANTLTAREMDIARMVADGLPTKAVARLLAINEGTVKVHLHHIYRKLGVSGRMGLTQHITAVSAGSPMPVTATPPAKR